MVDLAQVIGSNAQELTAAHGVHDSFTQMQIDQYNARPGNLPDVNCEECKNKGYIAFEREGFMVCRECKCMKRRKYHAAMKKAGLGDTYKQLTFAAFETPDTWQQAAKRIAERYSRKPNSDDWFFIAGQSGSGKTHLCTAICTYLVSADRDVTYIKWAELLPKLEQTRYKEEEQARIMAEIKAADVLYIDDFLKSMENVKPTRTELFYAFRIIDDRYCSGKKTMISTEFHLEELDKFDAALAGRIYERIGESYIEITMDDSRNMRKRGIK